MKTGEGVRPSPDALLAEANREGRGKLKIFLGAAPGVGKTYSMLRAAQARKKEGIDVIIGYVETHRRNETDALMEGLTRVPTLELDYRGINFKEMDVDAILARRPKLVLIDELAHTNVPGARHTKRYQDVLDILDAGIDVYSTLNVQHIESLNDIVARITGVTVRETVPDNVLQRADSIELIDLPPDELLQRLKEGKIYIPEQARLAMSRFFTPGNLTALRELALRQAAERVDEQMQNYMRSHAISGPWPTSDRVLVCISEDGQAVPLVRTAKRSAERRHAPWIALYIETHRHATLTEQQRRGITQALHLAESLGGETMSIAGGDIAGEILRVAQEQNVSVIILGKSQRSSWSRLTRPSVTSEVLKRSTSFDVTVMSVREDPRHREAEPPALNRKNLPWRGFARAALVMSIASLVAVMVEGFGSFASLTYIYLIGILLIAVDNNLLVSAFAATVAALACDYFFIEPRYSLAIDNYQMALSLLFFYVVALAIGYIGNRLQRQIEVTRRNAARTQALYDFNRLLAFAASRVDVERAIVDHIGQSLNARVALFVPHDEQLECAATHPADMNLDVTSRAAMDWCWQHGRPAGHNSDTLPNALFYGVPLKTAEQKVGVLALRLEGDGALTPDQETFLNNLASQSAAALLRVRLASDVEDARLQTETERLRSNLLSSISHDLRMPLIAIMGTAASLHEHWDKMNDATRRELFWRIEDDADRLNRFVQNFLDMSALVTGALNLKREPVPVSQLVQLALTKLARQMGERPLRLDIAADLPPVDGDFSILERALVNIVDNACKYAPPDQPITISARRDGNMVRLMITDRGAGIPEQERERVFDMFYRVKVGTATTTGAGLGLAICRGFIEAHGGRIAAQPGPDGVGTQIVIRLPAAGS